LIGTADLRNLWYGFVRKGNDFYEVGKVQLLRSWLDGPNRVRGIFGCGGEVTEGLHVHLPLFGNGCVCRCRPNDDPIHLGEPSVAFLAEFLERILSYNFLELRFKFFFRWFCVPLWKFYVLVRIFRFFWKVSTT